jgi:hypothetical protein
MRAFGSRQVSSPAGSARQPTAQSCRRRPDRPKHHRQQIAVRAGSDTQHRASQFDLDRRCGQSSSGCSATIGTKLCGAAAPRRISRRHVNTCYELTCQRRATSATTVPGRSVSSTMRVLSSSDHFRRRPGPVKTSARRYPASFASSLMSTIMSARNSLLHADPAHTHPAPKDGPRRRAYSPPR